MIAGDRVRRRMVLDHPQLWSIVRQHHRAHLSFTGGPDCRRMIVEYQADGHTIMVKLPMGEAHLERMDGCRISLEILDEYLSVVPTRVQVIGRVEPASPPPTQFTPLNGPRWATTVRSHRWILIEPVQVTAGEV